MGNDQSTTTKIINRIVNNQISLNNNQCNAVSNQTITGNTLNIQGGVVVGVDAFNISGNASAVCAINQQTSQNITNILQNKINQSNTTQNDPFNDFLLYSGNQDTTQLVQTVTNNMINVAANTCNAVTNQSISGNNVNIAAKVVGNISVYNIDSDAASSCVTNNIVSQIAASQLSTSSTQDNHNQGTIAAIISAFVSIAIVGAIALAIVFLFLFLGTSVKAVASVKAKPKTATDNG